MSGWCNKFLYKKQVTRTSPSFVSVRLANWLMRRFVRYDEVCHHTDAEGQLCRHEAGEHLPLEHRPPFLGRLQYEDGAEVGLDDPRRARIASRREHAP